MVTYAEIHSIIAVVRGVIILLIITRVIPKGHQGEMSSCSILVGGFRFPFESGECRNVANNATGWWLDNLVNHTEQTIS